MAVGGDNLHPETALVIRAVDKKSETSGSSKLFLPLAEQSRLIRGALFQATHSYMPAYMYTHTRNHTHPHAQTHADTRRHRNCSAQARNAQTSSVSQWGLLRLREESRMRVELTGVPRLMELPRSPLPNNMALSSGSFLGVFCGMSPCSP